MRKFIFIITLIGYSQAFAQSTTPTQQRTFTVGHLLDTTYKRNNIYTEFGFGKAGGLFGRTPGGTLGRTLVMDMETSFKVGFFPINKLLIGWDFSPNLCFSDRGIEGFRWSTGPFIRYYFPFYRVDKHNQLKSPVALYVFFNYYLGQYNPIVLDRPFDSRFTTGFSLGVGFSFKLKKNLLLNIELGPRYDFLASEFITSSVSTLFKVSLSYSFPSKTEVFQKKLNKINQKNQ